jgi:hypothetical protein
MKKAFHLSDKDKEEIAFLRSMLQKLGFSLSTVTQENIEDARLLNMMHENTKRNLVDVEVVMAKLEKK